MERAVGELTVDGMAERAGRPGAGDFKPFALSHEIGGTVLSVGEGVTDVKVGKQYALYPWLGCGKCMQCTDPDSDEIYCMGREVGMASRTFGTSSWQNGGFASHLLVPDTKYLVEVQDPKKLAMAATYTCAGLTAFS